MSHRIGAGAPVQWLTSAAQLILRQPRALFAVALGLVFLFVGLLLLTMVLTSLALGSAGVGAQATAVDMEAASLILLPLAMFGMLVPQLLIGGMAAVLDALAGNRAIGLGTAFAALRARWRPLCGLILLPLLSLVSTLLLWRWFGGAHYADEYLAMARAAAAGQTPTPPTPDHPLLLALGVTAMNWVMYALQMFAPIHVVLGGRGPFAAILETLLAFARNLTAMLLGGVIGFALLMAVTAATLFGLIALAVVAQAMPALGSGLGLLYLLLVATAALIGWSAIGYFGWRAMLADARGQSADGDAAPKDRIEV